MHQHDVDDTTTRKSDQGKAWPPDTPGALEAEDDIQQQTPTPENNTRGLGENKFIVTTKQDRSVHKDTFHQPQNILYTIQQCECNQSIHMYILYTIQLCECNQSIHMNILFAITIATTIASTPTALPLHH